MKKYEALVGDTAIRVVPFYYSEMKKISTIPLDVAFASYQTPFITLGLPKKLKKYIEKRAKNVVSMGDKTKCKQYVFTHCPDGTGIYIQSAHQLKLSDKNKKICFDNRVVYLMTLEQALEYRKYFPNMKFFPDFEEDVELLREFGLTEEDYVY